MKDDWLVNGRYDLHNVIGLGGMGRVYRATDRLTNQRIALKRVNLQVATLTHSDSPIEHNAFKVMLAHEFQTLAALRHPHIINVLDYGFDREQQPYFTMDYLRNADTIVEASQGQKTAVCVNWLIQTCQALAYLHRHHILHRDLKPANILVARNSIKVLDFGLASLKEQAQSAVGTAGYLAPEVIQGDPHSEVADLYAIGVIAYQLFSGQLPFSPEHPHFWDIVVGQAPDLSTITIDAPLVAIIQRLLEKEPAARYQTANDVIHALATAMGQPPPAESSIIRESFLQAAKFVGRDTELAKLTTALEQAAQGHGSAWLIGGQSGIGKSRLLRELRTRALVNGLTVLEGQSVQTGELPYQLWRKALHQLLLTTTLPVAQTAVLQPLIPDLARILGQEIVAAPELDGAATIQRLHSTIIQLFRQQTTPTLLILEDLHWEQEGLPLLKQLLRLLPTLPLLVVGSYRNDETPQLPAQLPSMKVMTLAPLTSDSISKLTTSILGETGQDPELLDWLQQETEGNAFFLVEVVRTLAEAAGRLSDISGMTLPDKVLPLGIQNIVQHRLARIPKVALPLLQIAAVAGRQLDLALLTLFTLRLTLDEWLTMAVNTAVLEVHQGQWRFTHDKLREGLLHALPKQRQLSIHRQIAGAMMQLYGEQPQHAAALAYHWHQIGDEDKERIYTAIAGNYAALQFALPDAIRHLSRAITLTPEVGQQYPLLLQREQMYDVAGERDAQDADLHILAHIAQDEQRALVALRQANYARAMGAYEAAAEAIQTAVLLAQQNKQPEIEATAYLQWGKILWPQGQLAEARQQLQQALQMAQTIGAPQIEADSLSDLGIIAAIEGVYDKAQIFFEQALAISRECDHKVGECRILLNLGGVALYSGDYTATILWNKLALERSREIGNRREEGRALNNLGQAVEKQGDYAQSITYNEQALQINREIGDKQTEGLTLRNLGNAHSKLGDYPVASTYLHQALSIFEEIAEQQLQADVMVSLALLHHLQEKYTQTLQYSQQAIELSGSVRHTRLTSQWLNVDGSCTTKF